MKLKLAGIAVSVAMAALFPNLAAAVDASTVMINTLQTTGENVANPGYQKRIKNLLIFQPGGWKQLPSQADNHVYDPTWSQNWNEAGYVVRDSQSNVYMTQMAQIRSLNLNTAVAVLLMPDAESNASGFGACLDGSFSNASMTCVGGSGWRTPIQLFPNVKYAAWKKGLMVVPFISINNYDVLSDPNRGQYVLQKLQSMVAWLRTLTDGVTLKTNEGKIVILTEGIPQNTNMTTAQRQAVLAWMGSQTDILWIDNLAATDGTPADVLKYPNIFRSAAVSGPYPAPSPLTADYDNNRNWCPVGGGVQDSLKSVYGTRYRYHFLDRWGRNTADVSNPNYKVCESVRQKWLNLAPYNSNAYPVVISQWNEYGEFHVFEPSIFDGNAEYNYLQWRLGQQQ